VIPETPGTWENAAEAERWAKVQRVLDSVTSALEDSRRQKEIGGALDARVDVELGSTADLAAFEGLDPAEVFRTSQASVVAIADSEKTVADESAVRSLVRPLAIPKCARSWRRVPDVGSDPAYPDLSARDADAVRYWDQTHA
jgi:isoleucyl-tRNA synthetase